MRIQPFFKAASLALLLIERAFGDVEEVQLKQQNVTNSACSITVVSTVDGMHFVFSYRNPEATNEIYYAALRIYDRTHLVAICPVEKTSDGGFVRCEFTVGKSYLDDSRFIFTENSRRPDGSETTSPTIYWFYLRDFINPTELLPRLPGPNLLDLLVLPAEQQSQFTRDLAHKLASSQVPTRGEAESAALGAFRKIGIDMREQWEVTGLFTLGRDVPDFGSAGDVIWEVRITRSATFPRGVSGIVWVSATTKTTKVLFP